MHASSQKQAHVLSKAHVWWPSWYVHILNSNISCCIIYVYVQMYVTSLKKRMVQPEAKRKSFFNFGFACFCLQIMRPKPFHGFLVNWIGSIGTSGRCRHTVASPSDAGDWDPLPSRAVSWLHVEGRCYSGSGAYPTLCWRWRSQYPHPNLSWIWNACNAWNAKKHGSGGNTLHKAHFECSNT